MGNFYLNPKIKNFYKNINIFTEKGKTGKTYI
nr:MAG TPA: hypothetical protein [Caudoviricetes sp.]